MSDLRRVRVLATRASEGLADAEAIEELDGLLRDSQEARTVYLEVLAVHAELEKMGSRGEFGAKIHNFIVHRAGLILAAAAALALLLVGFWFLKSPGAIVAWVERSSEAVWVGDQDRSLLFKGKEFELASGLVEVVTENGVRLIFEGPVTGRFASLQVLKLDSGKVYAEVPEEGRGFTVECEAGRVVDLGTRFAVEAGKADARVQVYEGLVVTEGTELTEGEAVRLESGKTEVIAFDEGGFRQTVGSFYEPFEARIRPRKVVELSSRPGWFSVAEENAGVVGFSRLVLSYPGLASSRGGSAAIYPKQGKLATTARAWPFEWSSAIVQLDDDLVKELGHKPDVAAVSLLSWGTGNPDQKSLRLVVERTSITPEAQGRLGMVFGTESEASAGMGAVFGADKYHPTQVFLIVTRIANGVAELWINPETEYLGKAEAPEPDVVLGLPENFQTEYLTIGQALNPSRAEWWLDELRAGGSWAEVTPGMANDNF